MEHVKHNILFYEITWYIVSVRGDTYTYLHCLFIVFLFRKWLHNNSYTFIHKYLMVLCHFSVDHQICFADCPMADFMLTGRFAPVNAQFSAITLQLLILFPVLCLLVTDPTLFLSQQNFLCASSVVFIILIILIITVPYFLPATWNFRCCVRFS